MEGNVVFKMAVKMLAEWSMRCSRPRLEGADIDWLMPHQANLRIIEATARKLGLPMDKVVVTVDRHANTSAAFGPSRPGRGGARRPHPAGQHVLLEAVGGGFTWGACLIKWS